MSIPPTDRCDPGNFGRWRPAVAGAAFHPETISTHLLFMASALIQDAKIPPGQPLLLPP